MNRLERFTIRVSKIEMEMIRTLSIRLQRSQSDAIRLLIREATQQMSNIDEETRSVESIPITEEV